MANLRPQFANVVSLLFILLHLGCFIICPTSTRHRHRPKPPRKPPMLRVNHTKLRRHGCFSSFWSFIKRIFSSRSTSQATDKKNSSNIVHQIPSPASSTRSLSIIPPDNQSTTRPGSLTEADYLPIRNEIHPCVNCGEVFLKPGLLEQHQSIKHAVCELLDNDPGKNIVQIIFTTGWPEKPPVISRVMKIHNNPKILAQFEEYREIVKSKAARPGESRLRDERCIADGNELLRFYGTTFFCDLGQNGNSSICGNQYCNACEIIGSGFSPKLDAISTSSNSWMGHVAIPEDIEDEFGFMNVKRAMIVCRVIAGRIGSAPSSIDKDDPGYDSLMRRESGTGKTRIDEEDELIVFNPRAVLPCFVIVYTA
ncbi:hypothetical protein LXL04_000619 [Taraxacum kok-saghyz]